MNDIFLEGLGKVPLRREYFHDDLDGWGATIPVYKPHRADHDPRIGNAADERTGPVSHTTDTFKYRGVTVTHHMEDDTYEVRGQIFMSLGDARRFIDDGKDL